MAIYEETYSEAEKVIRDGFNRDGSKPHLFAKVKIRFGEKYMVDYTESYIRPGIEVIEDFKSQIDEICNRKILPDKPEVLKTTESSNKQNTTVKVSNKKWWEFWK